MSRHRPRHLRFRTRGGCLRSRRRLIVERLDQRRVLATITGSVFTDLDYSFSPDSGQSGAAERLVYLDANDNARLDPGETFALGDSDGQFAFPDLPSGNYMVRLFNGTASQTQTYPIESTNGQFIDVADAHQLEIVGDSVLALTDSSLIIGNLITGTRQSLLLGDTAAEMAIIPGGNVVVVGSENGSGATWLVDPNTATASLINPTGATPPIAASALAIDDIGRGVLVDQASGTVYAVTASSSNIVATPTTATVNANTSLLTSGNGPLTIVAEPGLGGFGLRAWSNQNGAFLNEDSVFALGTDEVLAYDNDSGIVALRGTDGSVNLYDANSQFAELPPIDDIDGPVAIDGGRDLLLALSPAESLLKIIHLGNGDLIADLAIDLSSVGEVAAVAMGDRDDSIVVLGAAGITEIGLRKPSAHQVVVGGLTDPDPILFGVALSGSNAAPGYPDLPSIDVTEDTTLELDAPGAMEDALDANGDAFVLLQVGEATHGNATIEIDGETVYVPEADFFGSDSVDVRLHDGRSVSSPIAVEFLVDGTPDDPSRVDINIDPIPEDTPIDTPIGTIEVIDVDGNIHTIETNDPRIGVSEGEIIFIGGSGGIDHEVEPTIPLTITVTDSETGGIIEESITLTITDANDPVTAITPVTGFVDENVQGDIVVELDVEDQDAEQAHFLTVDDERFEVIDRVLRLKSDVEVDFESEPSIVINITATEFPGGGTFTQEFTVTVRDQAEQGQSLDLTNKTVLEFERGAVVGDVTMDGSTPPANYQFTVNDPRFEVDGTTLKLTDDQYVLKFNQDEIALEISAEDSSGQFAGLQEIFVISVLTNQLPYHNEDNPYDVNNSGEPSAADALIIINYMADYGAGPVGNGDPSLGYDVNGDGEVTALDALLIINQLNRMNSAVGPEQGESEQPSPIDDNRRYNDPTDEEPERFTDDPIEESLLPESKKVIDNDPDGLMTDRWDQVEIPNERSAESFAERVDFTLRLLSDEKA